MMDSTDITRMSNACGTKPHGNYLRYQAGCRCGECRTAKQQYRRERDRANKAGRSNAIVSAARSRAHLLNLQREHNVSGDAIALATDLPRQRIIAIRAGKQLNLREATERLILKVGPAAARLNGLLPADKTRQRMKALRKVGISQREIGELLGQSFQFRINAPHILARRAAQIRKLYWMFVLEPKRRAAKRNPNPIHERMAA